jgi:hypothetical protein
VFRPVGQAGEDEHATLGKVVDHYYAERYIASGHSQAVLGVPVLGVCFGAHLLVVALGASVIKDGPLEVGMGSATLTDAGPPGSCGGSSASVSGGWPDG